MTDIETKVQKIIADHLGCSVDQAHWLADLVRDLHADSLHTVEMVMLFEEEFGIEIEDSEIAEMEQFGPTVSDCIRLVERKVAAQ